MSQEGPTNPLGGEPRSIDSVGHQRQTYAPVADGLRELADIGAEVTKGEVIARIRMTGLAAPISGTLRGMVRDGMTVAPRDKIGEVDPRGPRTTQIAGVGKRPATIAQGVLAVLSGPGRPAPG